MVNFRHICKENVSEKHPPVCDLFAGENFKELQCGVGRKSQLNAERVFVEPVIVHQLMYQFRECRAHNHRIRLSFSLHTARSLHQVLKNVKSLT
jgi:murein endopeptidase